MSLKETFKHLKDLLSNITSDLEKSENGNKAASQRVRTGTVKLEKIAKLFRKESISSEKKNKGQKKPSKSISSSKSKSSSGSASSKSKSSAHGHGSKAKTSTGSKSKPASSLSKSGSSSNKSASVKAKPEAKAIHARTSVKPRQFSVKRATAKLPTKRMGAR